MEELSTVLYETFKYLRKTEFKKDSEKWEPSSVKEYHNLIKQSSELVETPEFEYLTKLFSIHYHLD